MAEAEPVHPVWGHAWQAPPEPASDPKQQAIDAAAGALLVPVALIEDRLATPSSRSGQLARIAVEAAWDLLDSENHILRVEVNDLEHRLGQADHNTEQAREQVERLQAESAAVRQALYEGFEGLIYAHNEHCEIPNGQDDIPEYEVCENPKCPAKFADYVLGNPAAAGASLLAHFKDLREALSGCLAAMAGAPSQAAFAEAERRARQVLDETGGGP